MVGLFLLFMLVATVNSSDLEDDKRMPPFIETSSKRYHLYNELETVELPCKATGIPDVRYEWLFNGTELQVGSGTNIIQTNPNDGYIQITKATKYQHSGTYQCRARNKYGVAMSPTITLAQTDLTYKTYPTRIKEVNVGDPLFLEPFNDITSTPKAKYAWKTVQAKDNEFSRDVTTSKRIAVDEETGILYFANTLTTDGLEDDRLYKLNARNRIKDMTTGLSPYKVIVTAKEPNVTNKPVQFLLPSSGIKKVVGIRGENVKLKCFFGGLPSPDIEWDQPPGGPPLHRIDCTKEFNTECEITKLHFSDAGEYKCTGKNPSGSKTAIFNLTVESSPTFAVEPRSLNISEGMNATFKCKPKAVPPAKIEWFSNGKMIDVENITDPRLTITKDLTKLTLTNVRKNREGTPNTDLQVFQCRISNEHGDAYASAYLNVLLRTTVNGIRNFVLNLTEEWFQPEIFNLSCNPTTDSHLKDQLEFIWKFNSKRIQTGHPYFLQNNKRNLLINITTKDTNFNEYLGAYTCIIKTPLDKLEVHFFVDTSIPFGAFSTSEVFTRYWWLMAMGTILFLTMFILIVGVKGMQGSAGGVYMVYDHEIKDGNNVYEEIESEKYHEYKNLQSSRAASKSSLFIEI